MIIELPIALVSENTALRCINRGRYSSPTLSQRIKDFCHQVDLEIAPHLYKIKEFMQNYDKKRHGIEFTVIHKTPKLFTKKKTISENSIDVDNIKYLQDTVFKNIGINDSQILALHSYKQHAKSHSIVIRINLINFLY